MPLPILTPIPPDRLVALALAASVPMDGAELAQLYALAVAACWDGPLPWQAAREQEAGVKAAELRALESWLATPRKVIDAASRAELDAGRQDAIRLKAEIRTLRSPRQTIPTDPAERATLGNDLLGKFAAANVPILALIQSAQDILAQAQAMLTAGYGDYLALDGAGFSTAPTGPSSAGALSSPLATEVMPSGGLR